MGYIPLDWAKLVLNRVICTRDSGNLAPLKKVKMGWSWRILGRRPKFAGSYAHSCLYGVVNHTLLFLERITRCYRPSNVSKSALSNYQTKSGKITNSHQNEYQNSFEPKGEIY